MVSETTIGPVPETHHAGAGRSGRLGLLLFHRRKYPAPLSPAPHRKVRGFLFFKPYSG